MWYVASQIVFCLLLAALLGFLIGWLLRKRWYADRLIVLQGDLAAKEENLKKLNARLGELKSSAAQGKENEGKWREMEQKAAAALREKDAAMAQLQTRVGELEPLTAQVAERENRLREAESRFGKLLQERDGVISGLEKKLGELEPLPGPRNEARLMIFARKTLAFGPGNA
jgi:DNA repair exonuclease SbcCD ATPase subunit